MFAQRLRELRRERGLTQIQLAQKLHVSNGTIGMWETGKREPDFNTTTRLANFFHVSTDYLLGNVNDPFFYLDNTRILCEINSYDGEEKAPTTKGGRKINDADIRAAFFGGADDLSEEEMDAMWNDAKDYIQYKLDQRRRRKNGGPD